MQRKSLLERIESKLDKSSSPDGCWLFTGCLGGSGYGTIYVDSVRRRRVAHRALYELLVGPVPPGLELDHLCRNRVCCNPAHLEPVTHRENLLRGNGVAGVSARKTTCHRGHEFTRIGSDGSRICRTCKNELQRIQRRNRVKKPRARGASNGRAVLDEASVREILRLIASGVSHKDVAMKFGVSPQTISKIWTGRTWQHIDRAALRGAP